MLSTQNTDQIHHDEDPNQIKADGVGLLVWVGLSLFLLRKLDDHLLLRFLRGFFRAMRIVLKRR
jgi:hypothetical protein